MPVVLEILVWSSQIQNLNGGWLLGNIGIVASPINRVSSLCIAGIVNQSASAVSITRASAHQHATHT